MSPVSTCCRDQETSIAWFWGLLSLGCLLYTCPVSLGQADPLQEFDILESYKVSNWHRCHRLCWYRANCLRYSFYTKDDPPGENWDNCVLHFKKTGLGQPLVEGWWEATASAEGLSEDHGCMDTPCKRNEMCVPVKTGKAFVCLSMTEVCKNFRNQYRVHNNLDWQGDTLWVLTGTDLQTCKDQCDTEPDCSSFVRFSGSQPACHLKKIAPRDTAPNMRLSDAMADTYTKSCEP